MTTTNVFCSLPNLGRGRAIHPNQTVHFSVAFKDKTYKPKAVLKHLAEPENLPEWKNLVGFDASQELVPPPGWEGRLEMDLFGDGVVDDLVKQLRQEKPPPSTEEIIYLLKRLNSMIAFRESQMQFHCGIE